MDKKQMEKLIQMRPDRYKGKVLQLREDGGLDVGTAFEGETLTQQQYKDQCDVNKIMGKYINGAVINHVNTRTGVYADITSLPVDYLDAMNTIVQAQQSFDQLPAELRLKFNNDPGQMISFLKDESKIKESIELGLRTVMKNPDYVEPKPATAGAAEQK